MQVRRLSLGIYEEVIGKVESVSVNEDMIQLTLSVHPMLVEIPKSEAKADRALMIIRDNMVESGAKLPS